MHKNPRDLDLWPQYSIRFKRLSRQMFVRYFVKLSATVHKLLCWQRKTRNLEQSPTESARCPKSDWGDNLGGSHSPRSKFTWPELQRISIRRTHSVDLGWVDISQLTIVVNGSKCTQFFVQRGRDGSLWRRLPLVDLSIRSRDIRAQFESCPKSRQIFDVFCYPKF